MLSRYAYAAALIQGASATLYQFDDTPDGFNEKSDIWNYYYVSPIYLFSKNYMVSVFPTCDSADTGTCSGDLWPLTGADPSTTSNPSVIWQMEGRTLYDLDAGVSYI